MYDLNELKTHGVSSGDYKRIFTSDAKPPLVEKLIDTIRNRIRYGRTCNLSEYRSYWAIDVAYEAPFNQTTPTLVQSLLSKRMNEADTLRALEAYGLSERELFLKVKAPDGTEAMILNPPVFYQVFIPIVKAYVSIRLGKLFSERDNSPLLPFTPLKQTDKNRVVCEIWTDIVDTISSWYGYPVYLKQAILQMLKYGFMIAFPKEEWHVEEQMIEGRRTVIKEGLRYDMPHPSRMSWDLYHPLTLLNTDTGPEWACHWTVVRAGDVMDNRMYWNRKSITVGDNWMDPRISHNYFSEVFPCTLRHPISRNLMSNDREARAAYYTAGDRDAAMFLTSFFWKIVPSRWGLANYRFPVWHRFDVAGDGCIIWAAPCAYNPLWMMGYDFDNQAGQASSLALETVPWQDHVGNIITQMILTAKQNLANITYYDENIVNKSDVAKLENLGERFYRGLNFMPFNSLKMARAGLDIKSAFHTPALQYRSINELQSMLSTALGVMERVLQFSAQETGSAASHYQSAREVETTNNSVSLRANLTGSGIDDGMDAWKRQLYHGVLAYAENDVAAQVSREIPNLEKHLGELGFRIEGEGQHKMLVAGGKRSLRLEGFARTNVPPNASPNTAISQVIFQTLAAVVQNPELAQRVGYDRIVKLMEQGAKLAGAPADFDLTSIANKEQQPGDDAMMQQLGPILAKLQENVLQTVGEKFVKPLADQNVQEEQRIKELEVLVGQLQNLQQAAALADKKLQLQSAQTAQKMELERTEFMAEQQREQQEHEQTLALNAAKTQSQIELQRQQTAAKIEAEKNKI